MVRGTAPTANHWRWRGWQRRQRRYRCCYCHAQATCSAYAHEECGDCSMAVPGDPFIALPTTKWYAAAVAFTCPKKYQQQVDAQHFGKGRIFRLAPTASGTKRSALGERRAWKNGISHDIVDPSLDTHF